MKPLFNDRTNQSIQRFLSGSQHAAVISAPHVAGLQELVQSCADMVWDSFVTIAVSPDDKSISIDQIRMLKKNMSLKQVSTQQRLIVISPAELMTVEAQNSFLKLLEEPPAGIKIALITADISKMLPTIRSRAAVVNVLPVSIGDALDHYRVQGVEENNIKKSFAISDGQPGLLYALLASSDDGYMTAIDDAKLLLRMKPYERLLLVDKYAKDKDSLPQFLSALHDVLRAAMRSSAQSSSSSAGPLAKRRKVVVDATRSIEKNANTKLVLTDVFLSI